MSIKSTSYITRENAINRILFIADLIVNRQYKTLEENSGEHDINIADEVEASHNMAQKYIEDDLEEYTDEMLEDIIDTCFYRNSMFDNYFIGEER